MSYRVLWLLAILAIPPLLTVVAGGLRRDPRAPLLSARGMVVLVAFVVLLMLVLLMCPFFPIDD